MSTYGSVLVKNEEKDKSFLLETTHDGLLNETIEEFLLLPFSIFERAKLENENLHKRGTWNRRTYFETTRCFYFYSLFGSSFEKSSSDFRTFLSNWYALIVLDTYTNTYASYFIWQRPTKWRPTDKLRYEIEKPDVVIEVEDQRLPSLTLTTSSFHSEEEDYLLAELEKLSDLYPEFDGPEYEDFSVKPEITLDKGELTVKMNLDLAVAALLWKDLNGES